MEPKEPVIEKKTIVQNVSKPEKPVQPKTVFSRLGEDEFEGGEKEKRTVRVGQLIIINILKFLSFYSDPAGPESGCQAFFGIWPTGQRRSNQIQSDCGTAKARVSHNYIIIRQFVSYILVTSLVLQIKWYFEQQYLSSTGVC